MTLNVVFDLGGVVFNWRPDDLVRSVFDDPAIQQRVKSEILEHNDWIELDRGTLGIDQAVERGASRTGLSHSEVKRLLDEVPRSLTPIEGTADLIRSVKDSGNKLFVLSNMHFASITYLEQAHQIWELFDGVVVSCRIQKVKPERAIYEHLLVTHDLKAAATVFIDDLSENLAAAAALGIQTIQFANPAQCRQDLQNLNCL